MLPKVLITSGDLKSIGLEVGLKALKEQNTGNKSYILFCNKENLDKHNTLLKDLNYQICSSIYEVNKAGIYFFLDEGSPVDWFKKAVSYCAKHPYEAALVTGPLSKASFQSEKHLGHTEYLRSLYPNLNLFMTFFSENLTTLLLSDHIPLSEVSEKINPGFLEQALLSLKPFLKPSSKVAFLGLNPHAGETGLIGKEDLSFSCTIKKYKAFAEGPFPSDGFFFNNNYKKYSHIIACYHDQGLIPFKLLSGFDAAQATLGLPFIRTSVDHGTAESIYSKNIANPNSMKYAIKLALELLEKKRGQDAQQNNL